jgi:ArsR family transcriptional regulator
MNIEQSQLFSVLSNQIRLRCLYLLAKAGEVCVCEVVEALRISQPSASKSLNSLKTAGLLSDRRDANWIYYSLRSDLPDWVDTIVQATVSGLVENRVCAQDEKRFRKMAARPANAACP